MNKMTKRLLAVCLALPAYALACDDAGETVWVNLQLTAASQPTIEWPLLAGRLKSGTVCIDKKQLEPKLLQTAALPVYIHPKTDLVINIDNASQTLKADWALDVYGIAGLPVMTRDGKSYQPSCLIQQLSFQAAEKSANVGGRLTLSAQVQTPELLECQGIETVKQAKAAIVAQWALQASFIVLDAGKRLSAAENQPDTVESDAMQKVVVQEEKDDKPSKLEQFLNLPSADEDAKKRMKKR
jgi:hypothetical protein